MYSKSYRLHNQTTHIVVSKHQNTNCHFRSLLLVLILNKFDVVKDGLRSNIHNRMITDDVYLQCELKVHVVTTFILH